MDLDWLYPDATRTYGPHSAKAFIAEPTAVRHHVKPFVDDGEPITFRWVFTRGMLQPRMSGYELAQFVIGHMPSILPFFSHHPRVYAEFKKMLELIITTPKEVLDTIVPWIRAVTREGPDDVIHMSLFDKTVQADGPKFFVMGDA